MPLDQDLRPRRARMADRAGIDALLRRSYPRLLAADYPPSLMVTAVPRLARAQDRLVASGTCRVIEDGEGRILAAGGWTVTASLGAGRVPAAEIRHLATDPDALRRGLARAIVHDCLAEAGAAGLRAAVAMATRTAVPFYAALGFRPADHETRVPLMPGIEFPVLRMTRRL